MVTTNGMMDISACGRQLFANSERSKGLGVLGLLAAMEQVDQANAEKYRVAGLEDSQAVGGRQATDKDFFRSDYMVHRRAGFYASVKLCSNRVIGGEDTNAENISGRYLADGALFLYRTSREYADVFPVWDWRRVPGVTCMTTGTTLEPAGRMATDFAGGASDGTYGVAGVDYNRDGVSGKKGWFFLDDGVMCLGAGIKGTTGGVRTSIDQRLAEGETVTSGGATGTGINLCKGIRWVLNGTVGYLFAQPQDMSAGVQRQSGTWKDVYAAGAPAAISRDVFSIWIDQAPEDGSYSYMILPGAKVEKLNGYVTHPPVEIVSNTREIQAVRDTTAGVTEILFYKAAELKTENVSMRADEACAVVSRHGRTYVADPTQKEQEVTLTIDGKAVSVTLPRGEMAGSSVRVD